MALTVLTVLHPIDKQPRKVQLCVTGKYDTFKNSGIFRKCSRTFNEFSEFCEFKESDKSLKHKLG